MFCSDLVQRLNASFVHSDLPWQWSLVDLFVASLSIGECCWLVAQRPSNKLVYLRDGSVQTLRQKLQIKLSISPSHHTNTGPTSPNADSITQDNWQDGHWSTSFTCSLTRPDKRPTEKAGFEPRSATLEVDTLPRFVCWLLNVPATGECISGTDLLRQLYVLPHWDRSCRSNVLSHPVTVYWHRADQSQCWLYNARRLAG